MIDFSDEAALNSYWAALNEHLHEVRPIIDDFCTRHGFAHVNRQALGRYPRIRIQRVGPATIWFDLWMELDREGRRFEYFSRDLPYELSAGADVQVPDGSKYGIRFGRAMQCFSGIPFDKVSAVLNNEMEKHLPVVEKWDIPYLKENGTKIQLGS